MSAVQPNHVLSDLDAIETREWMDALSAVIEKEGPERAHFLLEQLLEHARESSIDMPFSANTGYVNTIEPDQEAHCPGNIEIEERLRAYMRWNAMAMVVRQTVTTLLMVATWVVTLVPSPHWHTCLAQDSTISGMLKAKTTVAIVCTFKVTFLQEFMRVLIWKVA